MRDWYPGPSQKVQYLVKVAMRLIITDFLQALQSLWCQRQRLGNYSQVNLALNQLPVSVVNPTVDLLPITRAIRQPYRFQLTAKV